MPTRSLRLLSRWPIWALLLFALLLATLVTAAAGRGSTPVRLNAAPTNPTPDPVADFLPNHLLPQLQPLPPLKPVSLSNPDQTYRGKSFRYRKTLSLRVTAYAADPRCTFPFDGTTTASGLPTTTNRGKLVAADTNLIPFHSLVIVPGYAQGKAVPVLDRGGAIKGRRLDVLLPTFNQAKSWGVQTLKVKIYEPIN